MITKTSNFMSLIKMFDFYLKYFDELTSYFTEGNKRISYQYWFTSIILIVFAYLKTSKKSSLLKYVFNRKVWASRSAFIDYQVFLSNLLFKLIIIVPIFPLKISFSYEVELWLINQLGYFFPVSGSLMIILYSFTLIIAYDFMTYLIHSLFHRIPVLWNFHKIHHSATVLNPVTQYRIHPVELLINNLGEFIAYGLITGLFMYMNHGFIEPITYYGINIISIIFFSYGASLRHSHIKLKYYTWIEHIFLSPFQHQIHHSIEKKHYNKNFGSKLAIWDKIFNTLLTSKNVTRLSFGIENTPKSRYNTLWNVLIQPFKELFHSK